MDVLWLRGCINIKRLLSWTLSLADLRWRYFEGATRGQCATAADVQGGLQAGRAQTHRIYCSTEGRAHWQPAEKYNYWSTEGRAWQSVRARVCVSVCWDGGGHRLVVSALGLSCSTTWIVYSGLFFLNTWLCHDTAHTLSQQKAEPGLCRRLKVFLLFYYFFIT